jgi:hypothetical protein
MLEDAPLYRRLFCVDCWHYWLAKLSRDDLFKRCPVHQPESYMERRVKQGW